MDNKRGVFLFKKRILLVLLFFSCMFIILLVRLMWLQVIVVYFPVANQADYIKQSVKQRQHSMLVDDGRADFYDRNMKRLTGTPIQALVLFPNLRMQQYEEKVSKLAAILKTPTDQLRQMIEQRNEPQWWRRVSEQGQPAALSPKQVSEIGRLQLTGAQVVSYRLRYSPPFVASHFIGFVSQHPERIAVQSRAEHSKQKQLSKERLIGGSGLEYALDALLKGVEQTSVSLFHDGRFRTLSEIPAKHNQPQHPYYPLRVVTTLDYDIQLAMESIADEHGMEQGAIVVLDAENADVIAMLSRPQFNPYQMNPEDQNWANRALKAETPGSIFKTVVAMTALEGGYASPQDQFYCSGDLGQYHFHCWNRKGHGTLSFEQAFAQSCNIAFAKVIERIPSSEIVEMSRRLGMLEPIGWRKRENTKHELQQFHSEEASVIFTSPASMTDPGVRAQTSIGQRDVRLSPLQAANLVVTLLQDGKVLRPRAVKEIRYQHGGLFRSFPSQVFGTGRQISRTTAYTLRHWMREVVTAGTGKTLQDTHWLVAGKSGTAQAVVGHQQGENQWFIGFAPVHKPRYAVAVLVQKRLEDHHEHAAANIFREIMNRLSS